MSGSTLSLGDSASNPNNPFGSSSVMQIQQQSIATAEVASVLSAELQQLGSVSRHGRRRCLHRKSRDPATESSQPPTSPATTTRVSPEIAVSEEEDASIEDSCVVDDNVASMLLDDSSTDFPFFSRYAVFFSRWGWLLFFLKDNTTNNNTRRWALSPGSSVCIGAGHQSSWRFLRRSKDWRTRFGG